MQGGIPAGKDAVKCQRGLKAVSKDGERDDSTVCM